MIGRTVSHYRITSKLGAGGMGVVYEAEDARHCVTGGGSRLRIASQTTAEASPWINWARRDPDLAMLHGKAEFERLYPPAGDQE